MAFTLMKNIKKKIDYNKPDAETQRDPHILSRYAGIKPKWYLMPLG